MASQLLLSDELFHQKIKIGKYLKEKRDAKDWAQSSESPPLDLASRNPSLFFNAIKQFKDMHFCLFKVIFFARSLVWKKVSSPIQEAELTTLGYNRKPQDIARETAVFL